MKPMSLYLLPRSRSRRPGLAASALFIVAALLAAWCAVRRHDDATLMIRQIARLRAAQVRPPAAVPTRSETDQKKKWVQLQAERDFAWAPLFSALERAGNDNIELLEFHPDKSNGSVLLRGEARDEAALLDFIDALSQNPALRHVYLSHRKIRKRDRLITISFELKAGIASQVANR